MLSANGKIVTFADGGKRGPLAPPSAPGALSRVSAMLDFTSQEYLRDPVTGLAKLRAAGSVLKVRFPIIGKTWITTTSELASTVLKDNATFAMRKNGTVAGLRRWMPGWILTLAVSMLTMDEPDHTRLRSIVDEAFRRRATLDMEPRIFAIADELAAELFTAGSPADLVERYARKLPLSVICELLGLPCVDRPRFIAWTNLTGTRSPGAQSPRFKRASDNRPPRLLGSDFALFRCLGVEPIFEILQYK
jgi:cytochrome P450